MPRTLIYGEDGRTLKCTKERLGEILEQLEDNSNPADCTVFFRPSLGRGQWYGEPDEIIIHLMCESISGISRPRAL